MNQITTFQREKQGYFSQGDWQAFLPFKKSREKLKEEIWLAIEKEIKDFTKSLIEAILENTIKEN